MAKSHWNISVSKTALSSVALEGLGMGEGKLLRTSREQKQPDLGLGTKAATKIGAIHTRSKQIHLLLRQKAKVFTFYRSLSFIFLCSKPFQQHKHFMRQLHLCGCCVLLTEHLTFSMPCHFCLVKQVNKLCSYELWLHHVQTALTERPCYPRY